jgi:DNA-binding HxlR family transcriptional regulator
MKLLNVSRSPSTVGVAEMLENVLGCKWSLRVIDLVRRGIHRPGAMQRSVPGLSAKVLNERLRKLCRYGILEKMTFAEVPPRVEYRLTRFERKFTSLLHKIATLQRERDGNDETQLSGEVPRRGRRINAGSGRVST